MIDKTMKFFYNIIRSKYQKQKEKTMTTLEDLQGKVAFLEKSFNEMVDAFRKRAQDQNTTHEILSKTRDELQTLNVKLNKLTLQVETLENLLRSMRS